MKVLTTALCLALAPVGALPVVAQDAPAAVAEAATLTVTGTGRSAATPDMATVSVGVVTTAEAAADALAQNSEAVAKLIDQLKAAGIAPRDIQTSGLNLNPIWSNQPNRDGSQAITGYQVQNTVTVAVRDLDALGGLLDQLVSNGANTFNGLVFGLQDPVPAEDAARVKAVEDASRRARLLAEAAGLTLGRVISITEGGASQGPQPMFARDSVMSVPVERGEVETSASVTMVFELQ